MCNVKKKKEKKGSIVMERIKMEIVIKLKYYISELVKVLIMSEISIRLDL